MDAREKFILIALGREIQDLRLNTFEWTQEDLAEYSGLSSKHISLIERGQRNIRVTTLRRIAQAFDLSVQELCDFKLYSTDEIYFPKNERF